jgi:uncharacterized phage protein (TIGR02220 family)
MRRLRLASEQLPMLENVLNDFFVLGEIGWHHKRIDQEIDEYHLKCKTNAANGKKGGRPKNQPLTSDKKPKITQSVNSGNPNESESNPNQEPRTINQELINNKSIVGQAQRCLDLLNELAGTKFKHVDSNIDLLKARFKEGYTEQEVIEVIKSKCSEWVDTDGSQYLRPATLFGKTKFSQYHGQSHIAAKPQQQDLTALSNDELFKMATELKIRTQGLFRNDLITAIKGKK